MMKQTKSLALLTLCVLGTSMSCFAQDMVNNAQSNNLPLFLSIGALVIALFALLLSIRNIQRNKQQQINDREDFQLMLESTKIAIDKSIKRLRREMQNANTQKNNVSATTEQSGTETTRTPQTKRRRPYRRPQRQSAETSDVTTEEVVAE